jgi:hypothetical protein
MPAEQLPLLALDAEVPARRSTRQRARRATVARPPASEPTHALAPGEVVVEHRYPEAHAFLSEHGPDALAVLHVLAVRAEVIDGRLVARVSTRGVAEHLGFLSKDSAHRRLRQLRRAGVLDALPSTGPMDPPSYVLHLDGTGISVAHADPSR